MFLVFMLQACLFLLLTSPSGGQAQNAPVGTIDWSINVKNELYSKFLWWSWNPKGNIDVICEWDNGQNQTMNGIAPGQSLVVSWTELWDPNRPVGYDYGAEVNRQPPVCTVRWVNQGKVATMTPEFFTFTQETTVNHMYLDIEAHSRGLYSRFYLLQLKAPWTN